MSQIHVADLTFGYEGSYDYVFEGVSFSIDTDWKLGFIGRNGKGKTTFLNLLLGKYEYAGKISASVRFDYFPYKITDEMMDRCASDWLAELKPGCEEWRVLCELAGLHMPAELLYRPFSTLSHGERTRVLLAVLFSGDQEFLLIDEPTNHLDQESREQVRQYLSGKKGFILVSHDRNFIDGCVDHVLVINRESIEVQQGNFSSWQENKRKQDACELAENERLKKDIKRLTESAREAGQWADKVEATKIGGRSKYEKSLDLRAYIGEKSRRMQMRRKNLEHRREREIEEKSGLLKDIETVEALKIMPLRHYKEKLVVMEDCTLAYLGGGQGAEDSRDSKYAGESSNGHGGGREIISHFNFEVRQGERIFLKGRNGCGKSSVLKAILQQRNPVVTSGQIELPNQMVISYCAQDTSSLHGTIREYAAENEIDETLLMAVLRKLDFSRIQFEKKIEDYSGGQKKKVLIAGSLCKRAHLYIWDEPLNFIDVFSRMQIEELILKFKPTMILVEHDRAFMENVATRVVEIG